MKKYTTLDDMKMELRKDPEYMKAFNRSQSRYNFLQWLVNHHLGWLVERLYFILFGRQI